MAYSFLPLLSVLKHISTILTSSVGAGAYKDKVFVLDLNVAFVLSRLESCANKAKITHFILTGGFTFLHDLFWKKIPKKVKIGQIQFDWIRRFKWKDPALSITWR